MQMTRIRKALSLLLCLVLIAAMALFMAGCGRNKAASVGIIGGADGPTAIFVTGDALGEGEKEFSLTVTDGEGADYVFTVRSDKDTVGEALLDVGLITGEAGDYGLFVKTVMGIYADYDETKTYWAFYIDGEYALSGVDVTEIEEGVSYGFKLEKA